MTAKTLLVCGALWIALFLVLFVATKDVVPLPSLFLLLGTLLMLPVVLATIQNRLNWVEAIYYWLPIYGFIYMIKPIARFLMGEPFLFGEENLDWALWVAILGLLAFYAGYGSNLGPYLAHRIPPMDQPISSRRLRISAWLFIAAGFTGLWAYMEHSGGWREFWSLPHGYGGKVEATTAYIYQLPELMVVGFFLILFDTIMGKGFRLTAWTRVLLASVGGFLIYGVLWSRRTMIAWAMITISILLALKRGKTLHLGRVVLFWAFLFVAITLALAYRPLLHLGADPREFAYVDTRETALGTISDVGDEFDSFLAIVTLYPKTIEYDYFKIYTQIPLHPIPRLIWPKKPPLFVSSWDELLERSGITEGSSEGILGDLYIQWGLTGVLLGMALLGVFWRGLYAYLLRAPTGTFAQLMYAVFLGNVPTLVMQSGVSAFWKWIPFMIPALVLSYRFARTKERSD